MNKNELIERFINWNPEIAQAMMDCDHAYSPSHQNPWHLEGSVWEHTMMVLDYAAALEMNHYTYNDIINEHIHYRGDYARAYDRHLLMYAALLHDIGKIYTRFEKHEKKRVAFFGHENYSIQPAIDFLVYENVSAYDIEIIINLIGLHMRAHKIQSNEALYELAHCDRYLHKMLYAMNLCDGNGRIAGPETAGVEQHFEYEEI